MCVVPNACLSTEAPTTKTSASALSMTACPKCGSVKKSGKLSCCARGGAWFKNCGDYGDPNFHHTWVEGVQACKGFVDSGAVLAPGKRRREGTIAVLNTTRSLNTTEQQANIYVTGDVSDVRTTNCTDCFELAKVAVCASLLLLILHLQLYQ